ncbi:relaxase/mobilization nuclease domain-containing protein [Sphingobium sp. AN641]|uniref:relaxase/mobilization nuclease domain-containing protein n=1 Tax=Sphingobium sp. AN641 TaxID=3133443 RepID=UPI0030BCD172
MNGFEFSDQTLEDLERVQGARGAGRGKVDHRGNRALARDLGTMMQVPLRPSSGVGRHGSEARGERSARAIEQLGRTTKRAPQVVVKITSRIHGAASTVGAFTYAGRIGMSDQEPIGIETSEGKELMSAHDMMLLAREWQQWETADEARRNGATAIAMVFSMPPGTDPEKVREAVRDFAETDLSNRRWVMALHTDEAHPHVHLIIAGRDNDGRRFNPNREFLQQCRERFAENLRDRGVEADATMRIARGYPPKQDPTPVLKMRERGAEPDADKGRVAVIAGQSPDAGERLGERERERSKTVANHAAVREIYTRAASELEAHGGAAEADRAKALRSFVDAMPAPASARAEIIERLRTGNALPKEYAPDRELERLKARVQQRDAEHRAAALDRIERATGKIKSVSAELNAGDKKAGAGEGEPTVFDRIRAKSAELTNSNAPPDLAPDRTLAGATERLQAMQRKLDQTIKDRVQNKDRDRSQDRSRDPDREGPTR